MQDISKVMIKTLYFVLIACLLHITAASASATDMFTSIEAKRHCEAMADAIPDFGIVFGTGGSDPDAYAEHSNLGQENFPFAAAWGSMTTSIGGSGISVTLEAGASGLAAGLSNVVVSFVADHTGTLQFDYHIGIWEQSVYGRANIFAQLYDQTTGHYIFSTVVVGQLDSDPFPWNTMKAKVTIGHHYTIIVHADALSTSPFFDEEGTHSSYSIHLYEAAVDDGLYAGDTTGGGGPPDATDVTFQQNTATAIDLNQDGYIDYLDLEYLFMLLDTVPGDLNLDGSVDITDFNILSVNFGTTSGMTYADGDIDGDGAVTISDFNVLGVNFGWSRAALAAAASPNCDIDADSDVDEDDYNILVSNLGITTGATLADGDVDGDGDVDIDDLLVLSNNITG